MSVNIPVSTDREVCMPESLDPLKSTTEHMHRIWVEVRTLDQWYAIQREARRMFGHHWRGQSKVRRKLDLYGAGRFVTNTTTDHVIWFDVPDPQFATWIGVKLALRIVNK